VTRGHVLFTIPPNTLFHIDEIIKMSFRMTCIMEVGKKGCQRNETKTWMSTGQGLGVLSRSIACIIHIPALHSREFFFSVLADVLDSV